MRSINPTAMRFLSLLLLSLFSFSCALPVAAQHAPTKKVKLKKAGRKTVITPKTAVPAPAGPVLTFERTPCNGICPAYQMQVYADGRVAYNGGKDVPLVGKHHLTLPTSTVAEMLRQAKAARFETFEKRYSGNTSDLPGTIVAIRQPDGTLKTVKNEEGAPANVGDFFAYLGRQFDQLAQLNGLEK